MPIKKAPIHEYSEKERAEFSALIVEYTPVIYSIINKNEFIKRCDREDYYQEAVAYAWERYYMFDITKGSFVGWLYQTCLWGIALYRKKSRRYQDRNSLYESVTDLPEVEDEPYQEDHIEGLRVAILTLPARKQRVVQMYLDDEDLCKRSTADGYLPCYYYSVMASVRRFIRDNRNRFFEGIYVSERKLIVNPNGRINERSPSSKIIEMRTMSGELVRTFPSMAEAERQGFNISNISACCIGKRNFAAGYRWCFAGQSLKEIVKRKPGTPKKCPIDQFTMDGEFVARHETMLAATKQGFSLIGMRMCALGKYSQHKGFIWRYAKEQI